ncbi:LysR family transcriptional regulator [Bordetella hinzii]|uniref:LysR family transcriptional regulator n=1 Tax=Bordetella hinzii TaxID=103855 RepID=UPI00041EC883|nr:LysR family transcriptional regulator [Bordetella hinzii]AKQ54330.1 HTH-type transcriptional regulator DmlR [Bordetella hinzii]KCB31935.1 LysR substrate-binding domain protein [Bordetella hinzii L60]SNV96710.1 LysR family transcriptional regulator [Bordetella hinzii]
MDTYGAMQTFARVVELGSFAAAADRAGIARSVVTRQIAFLEEKYGVRLLNRSTRKLSLTDAGRAFYERVRPLLNELAELDLALQAQGSQPTGRLRIAAPVSFGTLHLGPAIADYLQTYPQVIIDLDLNDRVVDLVEDGYDVAVRIGPLTDSSLVARPLAPQALHVCASPAYLARHGTPAHPEDLRQHRCLHYSYASGGTDWAFEKDGQTTLVRVNPAMRANNGDVLRTAALAGHGIIQQPEFLVGEDLRAGRLVPVLPEYARPPITMMAVYPHRRLLSPKVRSFVEHLETHFGKQTSPAGGGRNR